MPEPMQEPDLSAAKYVYKNEESRQVLDSHVRGKKQLGTVLLARAAERTGASVDWINNVTGLVTVDNKKLLIIGYIHNQSQVAAKMVGDKFLTKQLLSEHDVSTPQGQITYSAAEARDAWEMFAKPVTLKPLGAYGGKGVSTDLNDSAQVQDAYTRASVVSEAVLVEEHIDVAEEYRALATPGECMSVVKRVLPYVIGDGRLSIGQLVREKNETRELNPSLAGRPIPTDRATERCLAEQGLSIDSVPELDRRITVRGIGGLSSGGEAYECMNDVDPIILETARQAVASIPGLTWGGCDLLVERSTGRPFVIEVNSTPGIAGSMYPVFGAPKDIARVMWEQRRTQATATPNEAPVVGTRIEQPKLVKEELAALGLPQTRTLFGTYAVADLVSRGINVVEERGGLLQLFQDSPNSGQWFTRNFEGPSDLAVTSRALRRYGTVRGLLRSANVPRVLGREVTTVEEIETFRQKSANSSLTLVPARREWGTRHTQRLTAKESGTPEVLDGFRRWIVQLRQPGVRLRVIASRDAALCVLGGESALDLKADDCSHAGNLAVQAIRAVPELRWGTVDILVRIGQANNGASRVLVEGVTSSPILLPGQRVFAGSLRDVVQVVTDIGVDQSESTTIGSDLGDNDRVYWGEAPTNTTDEYVDNRREQPVNVRSRVTGERPGGHFFRSDEVPRSVHGGGRLAAFTIALEAWRRGLSVTFLDGFPYQYEISDGDTTVSFDRALPADTTHEAFMLAKSKFDTLNLLKESGVRVPESRLIRVDEVSNADVEKMAESISYPVVIKPASASKGRGVFTNIKDGTELIRYYSYLVEEMGDKEVVLESYFEGEDYRVQVVGDRVAAVTWRRPANLTGDGVSTISELIVKKNEQRRANPALSKDLLKIDLEVDSYLEDQGYKYDTVLPKGHRVRLRGKANISTGGDIVDVTEWLPSHIRDAAVRAVEAIPGLVSAGVDVMIKDATDSGTASYVVIELNPRAHLGGHMFPSDGPGHNAAGAFLDYYFPMSLQAQVKTHQRLSFRVDDVVAPLRQGSAKRVELAPLAVHGYPRRERVDFPPTDLLNAPLRRRITQEAVRLGVIGTLLPGGVRTRLIVAGEDEKVKRFLEYVSKTLGSRPKRTIQWTGVVWHGFKVEQKWRRPTPRQNNSETAREGSTRSGHAGRLLGKVLRPLR